MRPYTPVDVEQRLITLIDRLEKGAAMVNDLDAKATRLRREFDHAYALAFLNADGSMDIRRYVAVGQTIRAREAAEDAEVALRHAKALLRAVSEEADLVRSISASVRSSMAAA
jgi:hypothetical protein